jgi:uncharacterized protein (DUF924 family)
MDSVAQSVYDYWFGTEGLSLEKVKARGSLWWQGSADTDYDIERRFGKLVEVAGKGLLESWMAEPRSALALIILNDQFPRNLYRGSDKAFSHDPLALKYSKQLVSSPEFDQLEPVEKTFSLMPHEHSENIEDQEISVAKFGELAESADPEWQESMKFYLQYAIDHMEIVKKFGRFPHRNQVLGRESTQEEIDYLESGGRRFGQ